MTRTLLTAIFLTLYSQTAWGEEKYTCHLNRFMEVANDGRFFGPETDHIRLDIAIKENLVFYKMGGIKSELTLIYKLGMADFSAKGGLAAMTTLHVWKSDSPDKYEIQYSTNYATSITIRTGICFSD